MEAKHQRILLGILVGLVVLLVLVAGFLAARSLFRPHVTLRLGDGVFSAYLARTPAEHERGLSGRESLAEHDALLFVYDSAQQRSIWMKDMNFSIDAVWLDDQKRVIHVAENLSPATYPNSFSANKPARYIVELAAGTVRKKSIKIDSTAAFDLTQIKGVTW